MRRSRSLAWGAMVAAALASLAASQSVGAQTVRDSLAWRIEMSEAGIAAADAHAVSGRAILGFFGGVSVGFFTPIALATRHPASALVPFGGVALIATAAGAGSTSPPEELVTRASRGDPWLAAEFQSAYERRLTSRRKRAAVIGGVTGTVTGVGLLAWLISSIDF